MTLLQTPLLLVGHGSSDEEGAAAYLRLVDRVRGRLPSTDVAGGFIELSPPPLTRAVGGLVGRGHRHVAAVPMMLTAAGHGKGDIPGALAREQDRFPGFSYAYGRPLGPHPALLDTVARRVDAALDGDPRAGTAVVLVGRGSSDPDANAEVAKVGRLLWEGRGFDFVETGFVSLAWPDVATALERCLLLGATRVVVAPYFLFTGVLPKRVTEQTRTWSAAHPEVDVRTAGVIDDCDALADVVVERYGEALTGDIRMNCDTCIYRIAMPGHEHRVGEPQTPHHHPDDPTHGHGHGHAHAQ